MKHAYRILALPVIALTLTLAGCDREGPAERAGERIDGAAENAGDKLESAADKVEDKTDR